ncbi:MerR family DNA-binding transcriptional regulator, partial [Streptomyces sp. NPDC127079]|uniref:MerR family DNA-binding transcriptional regulator n=1 Tax=Streptomyces sp. NPDC127079 TaxID=3347132 RepID=UPI00364C5968
MRIGELAARAGTTTRTLRYYEAGGGGRPRAAPHAPPPAHPPAHVGRQHHRPGPRLHVVHR